MSGGWPEVIPYNRLDVDHDLFGAGEGHHEVLLVDVTPAGEEAVGGQEEEEVFPLKSQVVLVEHLGKVKEEEGKNEEEEEKPWKQESSAPGSQPVTCQAVTHCREASKKCEEATSKNHSVVLVLHLVGQGHRNEGNAADEVADVKEKKASEEGEGGSEEPRGLLAGPQGPEGGGEVPDCVHPHHLLFTDERGARWRL